MPDNNPTRQSWRDMRRRCLFSSHKDYHHYGGRGIIICACWRDEYQNFLEDMGEKPEGLTLDRIDNDGNYSCGRCEECIENGWVLNCRWATRAEQNLNRRKPAFRKPSKSFRKFGKSRGWTRIKSGFQAQISISGTSKYLGTFKTAEEASDAYNNALEELNALEVSESKD